MGRAAGDDPPDGVDSGLYWSVLLPPVPTFAADLFLVGSNAAPVTTQGWLESDDKAPTVTLLREIVAPLLAAKRTFVVLDGGDGSLFGGG